MANEDLKAAAKSGRGTKKSPNPEPGARYRMKIKQVTANPGKDDRGNDATWFVILCEVLTMQPTVAATDRHYPMLNPVGSECAIKLNLKKEWAKNEYVSALTGIFDLEQSALYEEYQTKGGLTSCFIDDVLSDDNPAAGVEFGLTVWEKPLKGTTGADPKDMRPRSSYEFIADQAHSWRQYMANNEAA